MGRWLSVLGVLAVLLMPVAGCSLGRDAPVTRQGGEAGFPDVPRNLTQVAPADREVVPSVSGPRLGGPGTLSTTDYRGRVLVINVWGSWCGPCRKEAPALKQASEQTKGTAQFLGIATRDLDPAPAEAFVRANGISYPSIYDPSGDVLLQFAGNLPPSAIPTTLILDQQGRLAVRVLGEITARTLVAMVDDVAAGR